MPTVAASIPSTGDSSRRRLNHATLAEQVYAHLREQILSNELPPDSSLPEEAVAAQFEVSRVPVREALRRLAAEGLVTVVPRHGAAVSSLTESQFLDAYRVREALEALAIRLAIPRLKAADFAALDRLQAEMSDAAGRSDATAFFAANSAFHQRIVDCSGNGYLRAVYTPLMDQMRRYLGQSLDLRGGLDRSVREHQAILGAARAGDVTEAVRLLSEHIHVPQRVLEAEVGREAENLPEVGASGDSPVGGKQMTEAPPRL
jgi:DNA-binding GntR family transcriptional regulator